MIVATGTKIVNGIAIGKIRIYKAPVYEINEGTVADPAPELARFEAARAKVQEQQHAMYEKALKEQHPMLIQADFEYGAKRLCRESGRKTAQIGFATA